MQHADVTFAKRVGTAPGTTTFSLGATGPDPGYPIVPSVYEPDPNTDTIKILAPEGNWVTSPAVMRVQVPTDVRRMGPVPNDLELAHYERNYFPVHRGWINGKNETLYTLQGPEDPAIKWSVVASVVSAAALLTTTALAIMRYRKGR